ncbi:hypothetical protein [Legionella parisiensis]|uniref:Uncharacterized protein n=1 Tax=Legionella parisiensis TaxID=45071 RepID=A0A1E5JQA5_9GAMM|nr:hypothetical protein [Legionella parisiensis]KTD40268.1 hypothetical protein Lpar_1585 [Legionella parisiensis]OEH46722.1 hypothetical protein lpari_02190 [Legionella parisiensis]STX77620.1 Uncharacterised protein [Legionella parisiensis]
MKKLIIYVALSIPFFLTALLAFTAFPSALESPDLRTDVSSVNNNLSKLSNCAYWHHGQMASLALLPIIKIQSINYQ